MRFGIVFLSILTLMALGCSGAVEMTSPEPARTPDGSASHQLLGLYRFIGDPEAGNLDIIPLRNAGAHLNVLPFLEPPPFVNLSLEGEIVTSSHSIKVTLGLRHPFTGMDEFSGFDVCGIVIGRGSLTPYDDTDLVVAGPDEVHLMNADGYTRWWNPTEFPYQQGNINAYSDGILGTPHSIGQFTATLNGYKYFANGLDSKEDLIDLEPYRRGVFRAGSKNLRYYHIEYGSGSLVFNYAIDASWQFPPGPGPWDVPDDFPPGANRPEAWNIRINELNNNLWNDGNSSGGSMLLHIDVYDHFNAEVNNVRVESPGNFTSVQSNDVVGTGDGYATYEVIIPDATPSPDSIDLFISVKSDVADYGGILPGESVTAYFIRTVNVASTPQPPADDLILEVERNDYSPPGPNYPLSWITGIKLDWYYQPDGAQYAIYRSPLWASPYEWTLVGTTNASTTEFSNTTTGSQPIDWDQDYIYEVRPRSIPNDSGSEGTPTQRALVIMETNDDDLGVDPENPQWRNRYGLGGPFSCYYSSNNRSCDEDSKIRGYVEFSTLDDSSWSILYLPNAIPDIPGQTEAYIDFGFSTYYGLTIPGGAGFAPGTMTTLPTGFELHYPDFEIATNTDYIKGNQYNNTYCQGIYQHFGGGQAAFSNAFTVYRCTRYALPRLLETDADYAGIGIASYNVPYSIGLSLGIDTIALAVY